MYRLFIKQSYHFSPVEIPNLAHALDNITTRIRYLQNKSWVYGTTINSNHLLMKLCIILAPYMQPGMDTHRLVYDAQHNICSALRITSDYNRGTIHSNCLYTNSCVVIATDYSAEALPIRWQDYRPVRCLTHHETTMRVHLPYHSKKTLKEGISAIAIDIPMFAIMLKQWSFINNAKDFALREPLAVFITKYVLPKMITEQLDIAIRNRLLYSTIQEIPVDPLSNSYTKGYEKEMDVCVRYALKILQSSKRTYKQLLLSIPMYGSESYLSAVDSTIYSLNPYSYWAQLVVYVDWLYPLTKFVITDQKQSTDIEKVLIRISRYVNSSGTLEHIPGEIAVDFLEKYNACFDKWVTIR